MNRPGCVNEHRRILFFDVMRKDRESAYANYLGLSKVTANPSSVRFLGFLAHQYSLSLEREAIATKPHHSTPTIANKIKQVIIWESMIRVCEKIYKCNEKKDILVV